MTWMTAAIAGALVLATVSTLGDFVWATWIPRHRPLYGLTHGTLLFLVVGLYLGILARRPLTGALGGAVIGLAAASSFYLLAPLTGGWIMFALWIGAWELLTLLHVHVQRMPATTKGLLIRGAIASLSCGAAFYAVSGIWFPFNPTGLDYLWHFGAWTVAYLPGFAVLFVGNTAGPPTPDTGDRP
jgi:hypothetical protein